MRTHLHHFDVESSDPLEALLYQERMRFAVPATAPAEDGTAQQAPSIPFLMGSNQSESTPFATIGPLQLDANSHEYELDVTPGGFLRGVVVQVTNDGSGVLGAGALAQDAPYSVISSITVEDISGEGVLKPMSAFAYAIKQKWFEPWNGDPAKRPGYSRSINPQFTLRMMNEVRDTLAVLANTDARAQYRVKLTVAPAVALASAGAGETYPKVTIKVYPLKWAQPDAVDLNDVEIDSTPLGMNASRFYQHQMYTAFGATDNTPRLELVGNEIRCLGFIVRDSTGARVDLTDAGAGTVRFSMDDRNYWKRTASQWVEAMADFYDDFGNGTWTRETGVYIVPRFRKPGDLEGEYWLQTVEQNDLRLEIEGGDLGANAPGSIEILYDNLAVDAGVQLDPTLEGI